MGRMDGGEILREMRERGEREKAGGDRTKAKSHRAILIPKLDDLGITVSESSRWQRMSKVPRAVVARVVSISHDEKIRLSTNAVLRVANADDREARRDENAAKIAAMPPMFSVVEGQVFTTMVIDPPWDWGDEGDVDQFGRAKPPYATMPFEKILAMPVAKYVDKNAHMYLWITNRSLPKGFALLEAWGFRYVTCLIWVKPSYGLGNYFRGQTELVLFGVKGSLPLLRNDAPTVFMAPRGTNGHSSKPNEFYELVETCSPAPCIDAFARVERKGWTSIGGELM
jgi:N6-adenosine-specific RNA methylase IME4